MPNTYTELRKTTLGTATSSVTLDLTGISGYTDLVLVANFTVATASANLVMTFNGDTTSGLYSKTQMEGTGSVAVSGRTANANNIGLDSNIGDDATSPSIHIINLMNYANTSVFKTVLHRQSGFWSANPGTGARVGLWRNTNAITSITLSNGAVNFSVGSTFSLYGIANADQGAAKATGGIITEDANYWYHTFAASGTFTPKVALTCDYLVIAGGGGGGGSIGGDGAGGGGGAGGYRCSVAGESSGGGASAETSLSLASSTNYTVTIGAGGSGGGNQTRGASGANSVFATITSTGGGGAGSGGQPYEGPTSGGSGGGAGGWRVGSLAGATGTTNQGRAGGASEGAANYGAGGGGGASTVGANGTTSASGNGGSGVTSSINGSAITRAGGGGGGRTSGGATAGLGLNGGGNGGGSGQAGLPATANTGSGGGGTGNGVLAGGNGGSGIVIVRYAK
jgi:hypothetical protein